MITFFCNSDSVWSHSILEFYFPLSCIIPVISYLINSLERKQTISRHQVKHCKFSSLLLTALSLTGRDTQFCRAMLRTIEDSSSQLFLLVCPAKENHPVMAISGSSGLKGISQESPCEVVSWFARWSLLVSVVSD